MWIGGSGLQVFMVERWLLTTGRRGARLGCCAPGGEAAGEGLSLGGGGAGAPSGPAAAPPPPAAGLHTPSQRADGAGFWGLPCPAVPAPQPCCLLPNARRRAVTLGLSSAPAQHAVTLLVLPASSSPSSPTAASFTGRFLPTRLPAIPILPGLSRCLCPAPPAPHPASHMAWGCALTLLLWPLFIQVPVFLLLGLHTRFRHTHVCIHTHTHVCTGRGDPLLFGGRGKNRAEEGEKGVGQAGVSSE